MQIPRGSQKPSRSQDCSYSSLWQPLGIGLILFFTRKTQSWFSSTIVQSRLLGSDLGGLKKHPCPKKVLALQNTLLEKIIMVRDTICYFHNKKAMFNFRINANWEAQTPYPDSSWQPGSCTEQLVLFFLVHFLGRNLSFLHRCTGSKYPESKVAFPEAHHSIFAGKLVVPHWGQWQRAEFSYMCMFAS